MDPIIETTSPILTANQRIKPTEARDAIAVDRIVLRNDLRLYIREAWHVVEPSTVYLENWHIDLIAEYLEAVTARTSRTTRHSRGQARNGSPRRQIRHKAMTRPHGHFLRTLYRHPSHSAVCRRFRASVRHPRARSPCVVQGSIR